MRCSNIGPRGARNWFSVLDSPRQLLSPHYRGTRCSAECNGSKLARPAASWVLREAKQVAPTMRSGRHKPSKSRSAPPGAHAVPPARAFGDIGWIGATRVLILFHQGVEGFDRAVLRRHLGRRGGARPCAMIEVPDPVRFGREQRGLIVVHIERSE